MARSGWTEKSCSVLASVDRTRICKRTGATTTECQFCLLGRADTPERLVALSRGHWAVENTLHWAELAKVPPAKQVECQ